jgi:hypothetical protein
MEDAMTPESQHFVLFCVFVGFLKCRYFSRIHFVNPI